MHSQLSRLFTALQAAGVEWSLLRLPRDLDLPPGDVDLLVRPDDLAAFRAVAVSCGFAGLPGWQEWPTLQYFALDRSAARFVALDVTDRVAFGSSGELPTDLADGVLGRRVRNGDLYTPCPDDAFWLLLLHCLLDKGHVPEHYRERLQSGAGQAECSGELGRAVDAVLTTSPLDAAALRDLAAAGDWPGLTGAAGPLRAAWQDALGRRGRAGVRRAQVRRAVTRPALYRQRRGLSVALLGTNGAGKSTLAEGIVGSFPLPVSRVYMGLWKLADSDPSVARQAVEVAFRPFRAWRRYLGALCLQARGHLVVFDRYVYDARRPPRPPLVLAKRLYFWLLSHAVGTPDLTILLDLPGAVAFGRKGEDGLAETEQERQEFLALGSQLDLRIVDATRTADEVRSDVLTLIWEATRARWAGRDTSPRDRNGDVPAGVGVSGRTAAGSASPAPRSTVETPDPSSLA